jgi:hypothetical protein
MIHTTDRTGRMLPRGIFSVVLIAILFSCSSCSVLGVIANAAPKYKKAVYSGLAGQSVGVMVWADRALRVDWATIQIDLAMNVQDQLQKSKAEELKGTTFPVLPGSIERYQRDHPGIEATPITDTAPKLGVKRLIYIEISSFSTRSEASLQMFRGSATMSLQVIEIDGNTAKVAYQESDIRAFFPEKGPPEGLLNSTDVTMYRGTITTMAKQVAERLTTHELDRLGR